MNETITVSTDVRYALCECCTDHIAGENPNQLVSTVVTCPKCGQPCSCDGCVAEASDD